MILLLSFPLILHSQREASNWIWVFNFEEDKSHFYSKRNRKRSTHAQWSSKHSFNFHRVSSFCQNPISNPFLSFSSFGLFCVHPHSRFVCFVHDARARSLDMDLFRLNYLPFASDERPYRVFGCGFVCVYQFISLWSLAPRMCRVAIRQWTMTTIAATKRVKSR